MKKFKKCLASILAVMMMTSVLSACEKENGSVSSGNASDLMNTESQGSQEDRIVASPAGSVLTNHMSDNEKNSVKVSALQVLDEPWEKGTADSGENEYSDGVYFEVMGPEELNRSIDEDAEYYIDQGQDPEEIKQANIDEDIHVTCGGIVDGRFYGSLIIPSYQYDGGEGYCLVLQEDTSDGYYTSYYIPEAYENYEEFKEKLPGILEKDLAVDWAFVSYSTSDPKQIEEDILRLFEAMMSGEYQLLPPGTIDAVQDAFTKNWMNQQNGLDLSWELDKDAVGAIKDQVTEYHMHDDELDRDFVVHVTVPKDYDAEKIYPAIVLTDAVWRFNDTAKLVSEMDAGRAEKGLVISIGQDYSISNSDNMERAAVFCEGKDKFLDFITDNLMPYLSEIYHFDFANTTLFGHSLGGVFAHYALCNSDLYENQPFGCYIIGSPAFWSPYSREMSDYENQAGDYGYLERNEKIHKCVFITAGSDEDEDYEEYFEDGDSTTESIVHLAERLNAHCDPESPMAEAKLYKSHHYQYIPEMLVEYVDSRF